MQNIIRGQRDLFLLLSCISLFNENINHNYGEIRFATDHHQTTIYRWQFVKIILDTILPIMLAYATTE